MATLHIVYDPNDRVRTDPNIEDRMGIKVARISLAEPVEPSHIGNLAIQLSMLLLEEIIR